MSIGKPLYGIDVSGWQKNLDMRGVKNAGYAFCIVKATEGPYRDGTTYTNPLFVQQMFAAKVQGLVGGVYHFLVETDPMNPQRGAQRQVDHFLSVVGEVTGKLVVIDFEAYNPPYGYLTPTNATLFHFVRALRQKIGNHPIGIYSTRSFWNEGDPTGPWEKYGADWAWVAHYETNNPILYPKQYYARSGGFGFDDRLGGKEPVMWQFTPAGRVDGQNLDVNACSLILPQLKQLAGQGELPDEEEPEEPGEWTPATGPLAPPGFVRQEPRAGNYQQRHPTRYNWRPDVEKLVRDLYGQYGKRQIHINTYYDHPEGFWRTRDSIDVWGPDGRNDPIDPALGERIMQQLFRDPGKPDIEWIIWRRRWWLRSRGTWEPFGHDWFTFHDDHIHVTYLQPAVTSTQRDAMIRRGGTTPDFNQPETIIPMSKPDAKFGWIAEPPLGGWTFANAPTVTGTTRIEQEEQNRKRAKDKVKQYEKDWQLRGAKEMEQDLAEAEVREKKGKKLKKVAKDGGRRGSVEALIATGLSALALQYGVPDEVAQEINVTNVALLIGAAQLVMRVAEALIADSGSEEDS